MFAEPSKVDSGGNVDETAVNGVLDRRRRAREAVGARHIGLILRERRIKKAVHILATSIIPVTTQ